MSVAPRIRAALVHLMVGVVATWPMVTSPFERLLGHPDVDVWNHAWGPWWFAHRFSQGALPLRCDVLGAPDGGTLWFIDPIGATLGAPFVGLLGSAATWNGILLFYAALASAAGATLARRVAGPGPHVAVAALALAFGPYFSGELHNGISEAVNIGPCVFALVALDRAFREGGRRAWLTAGAWLALTALGTPYYALAAAICGTAWAIPWLWKRPGWTEIARMTAGASFTLALLAPVAWAIMTSVIAEDALVDRASDASIEGLLRHNAVDPRTFVAPGGFQSVDLSAVGEVFVHSGYLGWSCLLFAAVGLWKTRRWGFAAG